MVLSDVRHKNVRPLFLSQSQRELRLKYDDDHPVYQKRDPENANLNLRTSFCYSKTVPLKSGTCKFRLVMTSTQLPDVPRGQRSSGTLRIVGWS